MTLETAPTQCFAAALRRFYRKFPDAARETARHFARDRFMATCEKLRDKAQALLNDGTTPRRLMREAVRAAYLNLCEEAAAHNSYAA